MFEQQHTSEERGTYLAQHGSAGKIRKYIPSPAGRRLSQACTAENIICHEPRMPQTVFYS